MTPARCHTARPASHVATTDVDSLATTADSTSVVSPTSIATTSPQRPVVNAPRGVKVVFSREGVIADDVIRDLVRAGPVGRVVVVVSSDQELRRDVTADGARGASADDLLRLLQG